MYKVLLIAEDKFFTVSDLDGRVLQFSSEEEAWLFIRAYELHKSKFTVAVEANYV